MKRVTRAKRAAKSTAVDSPAEEAVDNEVDCVDSPVVKPKRKSRKEEVVDSDVEEEKEVEGKKSKRKTRKEEVQGSDIEEKEVEEKKTKKRGKKKTTSSSKRKSRSSKFYDHHSSDEGSAEDIRDTAIELKNPKSDKQKEDENQTEEKQVQDVQEKHDQDARLAEKRENTDQKDSQDKKVNEEREFNKNSEEKKDDRKSQEKTSQEKGDRDNCDEEMKSVKKDDKIVQDHEDKKNSEHVSLEKVSKKESEIENIIVQDILTENISKKQNETRNNNLRTNAEEEPKQEIKQSKEISNQEIQPIQDSIQHVLTEKVTESDLEIEKVLEPDNSKEEIEKSSEKEICGEKTGEPAFQKESTPKTDGHQKSEKRHTKSDAKDKNRREVKVREDLDKKLSEEQEQSKDIPREKIIGDSNDENALNKSDVVSSQEESTENGPSTPFVLNRKRKWGSRPAKITTQKSLTISTDVLKDIIPDVKPVEFDEVIEHKKHEERRRETEKIHKPILPKIVIDNTVRTDNIKNVKKEEGATHNEPQPLFNRKVSIVKENDIIMKPLSPPRNKSSSILHITNLVRPFTLPQLKNLLQRTGRIVEDGFWIDRIKSKCYVKYETEDQAVETRHALHGVTWPISNPKALQVDFSTDEAFDKAKISEENPATPASTIPGTVEDWLREQDLKKARDDLEKPWQRKAAVREWDVGKGDKEKEHPHREEKPDRRRHRTPERHSPEPAKKFKKKEEEAPAKLLDDLFRKTKTTPCIYWLPLSTETIAVKEEQRRVHMLEHERRMQEIRRQRRH